jgi:hypothetical protein
MSDLGWTRYNVSKAFIVGSVIVLAFVTIPRLFLCSTLLLYINGITGCYHYTLDIIVNAFIIIEYVGRSAPVTFIIRLYFFRALWVRKVFILPSTVCFFLCLHNYII